VEVIDHARAKHNQCGNFAITGLLSMHGECGQVGLGGKGMQSRWRDLLKTTSQIATPVSGRGSPTPRMSNIVSTTSGEVVKVE
jgi:hypothetical protein